MQQRSFKKKERKKSFIFPCFIDKKFSWKSKVYKLNPDFHYKVTIYSSQGSVTCIIIKYSNCYFQGENNFLILNCNII